jgi:hypothetical protein
MTLISPDFYHNIKGAKDFKYKSEKKINRRSLTANEENFVSLDEIEKELRWRMLMTVDAI